MAKFKIIGGKKLSGEFQVSGAKNAALKMITASVMIPGKVTLHNVPDILDVARMIEVIESLGAKTNFSNNTLEIDATTVNSHTPDEEPVQKLRGSVVIIGPLLSRFGKADFSQPGGCLIGARPIDFHLKAFSDFGITIEEQKDCQKFKLYDDGAFRHGDKEIVLEEMSVTTTENALMAAVLRDGKTTIDICACEPEIVDLANFLNSAGAKISGAGTHKITVLGVRELKSVEYTVIPDRIEAGTVAIAAAVCGGSVRISNIIPEHLSLVFNKFKMANIDFSIETKGDKYADLIIDQKRQLVATHIDTRPYPGFPTDLQSPYAVLSIASKGKSRIFETLFSARFDYANQLKKMGAEINVINPYMIEIDGPSKLQGQVIECSDLRGGAALIIAGLMADGETIIDNIEYVDRGYENFDLRLAKLGADIERIS